MIKSKLTGTGISSFTALQLAGTVNTAEAGAGTTNADATVLDMSDVHYIGTAANNSGVKVNPNLSAGDSFLIFNADANTLLLYPVSTGKLNNGTATTGTVSCATKTNLRVTMVNSVDSLVEGPST